MEGQHIETENHSHSHLWAILESPINLTCTSLDCGRKPESPEKTHAGTRRTCKLHLLWGDSASHCTIVPPLSPWWKMKKQQHTCTVHYFLSANGPIRWPWRLAATCLWWCMWNHNPVVWLQMKHFNYKLYTIALDTNIIYKHITVFFFYSNF